MEQHIHCALCGRAVSKPEPGTVAPAMGRGIICFACASALNIIKEKPPVQARG